MRSRWLDRVRKRGFVGPRFEGVLGKLRFLFQNLVIRTDVVSVAELESMSENPRINRSVSLEIIHKYEDLAPYVPAFDSEYFRGYTDSWKRNLESKETLVLALMNGQVAGFGWIQAGRPEGVSCDYACLLPGQFRIYRVGVLPSFRRQGVNTAFYVLVLRHLFDNGAMQVFVDCNKDNFPSLKAQRVAGFHPIGELTVLGPLLGSNFMRWGRNNKSHVASFTSSRAT